MLWIFSLKYILAFGILLNITSKHIKYLLHWCLQRCVECVVSKSDMVASVVASERVIDLTDILTAGNYTCIAPLYPQAPILTHTHTHSAYYTHTHIYTTKTPKQATPPCTCPQPHVDTLAVKLLRFTWRHNWHKLLSRWYRSCCLRPSIPLLSSFLPSLKDEHRDKEASLCMILISRRTSPRS